MNKMAAPWILLVLILQIFFSARGTEDFRQISYEGKSSLEIAIIKIDFEKLSVWLLDRFGIKKKKTKIKIHER